MARDATARRGDRPTLFISLVAPDGVATVADWIRGLVPAPKA